MNSNRVLLAVIGICLVATAAHAQRGAPGAAGPDTARAASLNAAAANLQTAWWTDAALMTRLGLTDVQKARIENIFQAHRSNIALAKASLESAEAQLSRFLAVDAIDRAAVQVQGARVIQARSQLESVNYAMTLEMREQLTAAQWSQLQTPGARGAGGRGGGPVVNPAPGSFAAVYDSQKQLNLDGTVAEFIWEDPHSWIIFDVVGSDGRTTRWKGELAPATNLARSGWTATTLKPGDRINVQGSDAHDSSLHQVNIRVVRRADGTRVN
jgi:Spy/CpxP family protein refolding chaperone